jgi:hypothetical protein
MELRIKIRHKSDLEMQDENLRYWRRTHIHAQWTLWNGRVLFQENGQKNEIVLTKQNEIKAYLQSLELF